MVTTGHGNGQVDPAGTVKVGIVGCGIMGKKHAESCLQLPGVSVASVADPQVERARTLAADTGAKAFGGTAEMLAAGPLDAVVVATPPGYRREAVELAASAGAAVFGEKPIALDMASVQAMCRAIDGASVVNSVGFQLRYSPLAHRAQELIAGRTATHLRSLTTTSYYLERDMPLWYLQRQHSGGPLLEQSIHMIDMARRLVGEITQVSAVGYREEKPDLPAADSEDAMVLSFRFEGGALGSHVDSCGMDQFNWEVELFGEDWRLQVDFARNRLRGRFNGDPVEEDPPKGDYHLVEMEAFIAAVRARKQDGIMSSFADAGVTLATVLAARESLDAGGEWRVVGV